MRNAAGQWGGRGGASVQVVHLELHVGVLGRTLTLVHSIVSCLGNGKPAPSVSRFWNMETEGEKMPGSHLRGLSRDWREALPSITATPWAPVRG